MATERRMCMDVSDGKTSTRAAAWRGAELEGTRESQGDRTSCERKGTPPSGRAHQRKPRGRWFPVLDPSSLHVFIGNLIL